MKLTFTVPFPCPYQRKIAHLNEIDDALCPLYIKLAVSSRSGDICESRLTGVDSCGIEINARRWNETHVINVVHQDTGNYQLTPAEAEMKMYLKTSDFRISKIWSDLWLPVVNVMNDTYMHDCNIM